MNSSIYTFHRFLLGHILKRGAIGLTTLTTSLYAAKQQKPHLCDAESFSTHFSLVTYDANNPTEDRCSVSNRNEWNGYAVFDGHGGWQVSEYSKNILLPTLLPALDGVKAKNLESVYDNILSTFDSIERRYIDLVRPAYKLGHGSVASVGSCVVLALLREKELYVAHCGDCRAVLGSQASKDSLVEFEAIRLTNDHNAREPREVALLRAAHPDEPDIVLCKSKTACYVKGRLQLTCALGDLYLKYPEFNPPPNSHRSLGRHIAQPYSPPYVRSVPDITHRTLLPQDKFLILASDGVWDFLSDQEAVTAVGACGDVTVAADVILGLVLERAAAESGLSLDQLKALPLGNARRHRHDDTTIVVIKL